MSYDKRMPSILPGLEQTVNPAVRIIGPRPAKDVGEDVAMQTVTATVLSAADVLLFSNVSAAIVFIRNFTVGGTAIFLLDSTYTANGVVVGSNGGAIWNQAAPGAAEIRVFMAGTSVYARAGATRNNNVIWATMLRVGPSTV